jgi:peptide-methionine (S)-S-oxide reductase
VTRVDQFSGFYRAEDYHQDYLIRHPDALYIATYDLPKVRSLRTLFPDRYLANHVRS